MIKLQFIPALAAVFLLATAAQPVLAQYAQDGAIDDDVALSDDFDDAGYGQEDIHDPLEGLNRGIYSFNQGVDTVILKPASEVYGFVVPEFGQDMVTNFLQNLDRPIVFISSVAQGDAENSFVTLWRFIFNSTLGVFGLFDIATELGVPEQRDEDFGQVLGAWGLDSGPYLVVPVLGPSSLRDFTGRVGTWFADPWNEAFHGYETAARAGVGAIDYRHRNDRLLSQIDETSFDPYATVRSLYLQRRVAQVDDRGGWIYRPEPEISPIQ